MMYLLVICIRKFVLQWQIKENNDEAYTSKHVE
jgi:hypothetical protein